jgi:hypothetical protein
MLVFWKQKLVLLAVPKTGTSALEQALAAKSDIAVLEPPELKHAPMYRYNRFFRPMFEKPCKTDDIETMAIIREPVSWLGSWYRYRSRPALDGSRQSTGGISFEDFVEGYLSEPRKGFADVGAQSKFVEPRPNGTAVTHLFRYEAFDRFLGFLEDRLDCRIDLPRLNTSPPAGLDLAPETEARLRRACAEDFALWEGIGG